jgi:serine/threonine protein kinase
MANESDHINKVFGSYRITAKIASGGFATVYLCEHIILSERQGALKLLHANHLNAAHKHESFIQEARLL